MGSEMCIRDRRKIFTKLDITSRRELHVALAQLGHDDGPAQPRA